MSGQPSIFSSSSARRADAARFANSMTPLSRSLIRDGRAEASSSCARPDDQSGPAETVNVHVNFAPASDNQSYRPALGTQIRCRSGSCATPPKGKRGQAGHEDDFSIVHTGQTKYSGHINSNPVFENSYPYFFIPEAADIGCPMRRVVGDGHARTLGTNVGSKRSRCDQHRPTVVLRYTVITNR